jgi:hypothetical protein
MRNSVILPGLMLLGASCLPAAAHATDTAQAETLVCNGTRANGTTFNLAFEPNTTPAPTPGAACAPSGKQLPKGTAVMGHAPKAPKVYAAVITAPAAAGGGPSASANGAQGETLVCNGTRANGTTFNFALEPNATPAPTLGAACAPSGKQIPKGTVIMGHAPKAPKVYAAVIGTPPASNGITSPPAGGSPNANPAIPPGQALVCSPAGYSYNIPFKADANPAPTLGAICALSDDMTVRGTVSIGPPGGLAALGLSAVIVGPPPAAGTH